FGVVPRKPDWLRSGPSAGRTHGALDRARQCGRGDRGRGVRGHRPAASPTPAGGVARFGIAFDTGQGGPRRVARGRHSMSADETHSLADQAAAWVPPWARQPSPSESRPPSEPDAVASLPDAEAATEDAAVEEEPDEDQSVEQLVDSSSNASSSNADESDMSGGPPDSS